eukprot:Sspe_Gene.30646::Locus_15145_Transcript_1_1_Confidence_1.000_Length_2052::g.30646::m.30646
MLTRGERTLQLTVGRSPRIPRPKHRRTRKGQSRTGHLPRNAWDRLKKGTMRGRRMVRVTRYRRRRGRGMRRRARATRTTKTTARATRMMTKVRTTYRRWSQRCTTTTPVPSLADGCRLVFMKTAIARAGGALGPEGGPGRRHLVVPCPHLSTPLRGRGGTRHRGCLLRKPHPSLRDRRHGHPRLCARGPPLLHRIGTAPRNPSCWLPTVVPWPAGHDRRKTSTGARDPPPRPTPLVSPSPRWRTSMPCGRSGVASCRRTGRSSLLGNGHRQGRRRLRGSVKWQHAGPNQMPTPLGWPHVWSSRAGSARKEAYPFKRKKKERGGGEACIRLKVKQYSKEKCTTRRTLSPSPSLPLPLPLPL